ncbi:MAG: hypothetical protein AB1515_02485 [Nitrospirota bacterium]
MPTDKQPELFEIDDVQLFAPGEWHLGDVWTAQDIARMIEDTHAAGIEKIPVRLGHGSSTFNPVVNGEPAAGWASNFRMVKDKLVGKFTHLGRVVRDAIARKNYSRVSIEVYRDYRDAATGRTFSNILKGVALLGYEWPAVSTLEELNALYSADGRTYRIITMNRADLDTDPDDLTPHQVIEQWCRSQQLDPNDARAYAEGYTHTAGGTLCL